VPGVPVADRLEGGRDGEDVISFASRAPGAGKACSVTGR
jgi:hypothetical protein